MMDKKIKWRHLKALHQVYILGSTRNKVENHPYINYLMAMGLLQPKVGKKGILEAGFGFSDYYRKEHLDNFIHYEQFLDSHQILNGQSNYGERDIKALMFIVAQKEQILKDRYSRKKLSALFFKEGAKHLDKTPGLERAVLSLLGIEEFPGKDPKDLQYRFVVDCPTPKCIVLCENIDFLLMPWVARENDIELWYAGGNNIEKLNHLPPIDLPIYYSCDWDYHGLDIYQRVLKKIPQIALLLPSAIQERKPTGSANHNSHWRKEVSFSGLDPTLYGPAQYQLISELIDKKQWIEEENNDLLKMLKLCAYK